MNYEQKFLLWLMWEIEHYDISYYLFRWVILIITCTHMDLPNMKLTMYIYFFKYAIFFFSTSFLQVSLLEKGTHLYFHNTEWNTLYLKKYLIVLFFLSLLSTSFK